MSCAYKQDRQIPTRRRKKFMRRSMGASTRRRIMSFSSHSLCALSCASLSLRVGLDRFKRLLQNLEHGKIARPVRRPLALNNISERRHANHRAPHGHGARAFANAFERSDAAHFIHEVHLQGFVVVHHPDHAACGIERLIKGRAESLGHALQFPLVGGRSADEKVQIDRGHRRPVQRCRGVAYKYRFQILRLDRASYSRDDVGGVHSYRLLDSLGRHATTARPTGHEINFPLRTYCIGRYGRLSGRVGTTPSAAPKIHG